MVNVPAMTPTDVFKAPRPMTSPANMVDWKVPSSDEKTRKSEALGGQKASAAGKYVDVVVPQAPSAAEKVRYSTTMGAPPAPYAFRREQDDAIVPEFKTQQHRSAAPNAAVPELHHAFQLAPPPAAVPDLDFLDMDDWTSPFDLELSFDSIFDSWDEHHLLFNEARMMNQTRHAVVSETSSEQSNDVASAENQSNGAAQVPSQESFEVSEEVDEFTRNRRLCLQRYREKKRNRKFSKKVRYHLRKMNADRRPRYKGRFIKKGEVIPQELLDAEAAKKAEAAAAAAAK